MKTEKSTRALALEWWNNLTSYTIDTTKGLEYDGIKDVEYLRDKLFAALKVPKAFLGYDADVEGKATLAHENKNNSKEFHFNEYKLNNFTPANFYNELTGREIEEIWRKETKDGSDREIIEEVFPDLKPNQKQFKEFNPELFKAYIDKFSDEDKIKAFNILISFENVKWYMIEELSK